MEIAFSKIQELVAGITVDLNRRRMRVTLEKSSIVLFTAAKGVRGQKVVGDINMVAFFNLDRCKILPREYNTSR